MSNDQNICFLEINHVFCVFDSLILIWVYPPYTLIFCMIVRMETDVLCGLNFSGTAGTSWHMACPETIVPGAVLQI